MRSGSAAAAATSPAGAPALPSLRTRMPRGRRRRSLASRARANCTDDRVNGLDRLAVVALDRARHLLGPLDREAGKLRDDVVGRVEPGRVGRPGSAGAEVREVVTTKMNLPPGAIARGCDLRAAPDVRRAGGGRMRRGRGRTCLPVACIRGCPRATQSTWTPLSAARSRAWRSALLGEVDGGHPPPLLRKPDRMPPGATTRGRGQCLPRHRPGSSRRSRSACPARDECLVLPPPVPVLCLHVEIIADDGSPCIPRPSIGADPDAASNP